MTRTAPGGGQLASLMAEYDRAWREASRDAGDLSGQERLARARLRLIDAVTAAGHEPEPLLRSQRDRDAHLLEPSRVS